MKNAYRKNWSKIEDRCLVEVMRNEEHPVDWEELTVKMRNNGYIRNSKQIKSRWTNNLDPDLVKEKWAKADILKLFQLYDLKGNRWQEIAASFEGRTDNCIKNQLFSSTRKGLRSIIKELGVDTGYSYTTIINQIKPKILAEFLLQKLNLKESADIESFREVNASDLIKSFIFKSKNIYQSDPIYEQKEIVQTFMQILVNLNNEYMKKKKLSKVGSPESIDVIGPTLAVDTNINLPTQILVNPLSTNSLTQVLNFEEANCSTSTSMNDASSVRKLLEELSSVRVTQSINSINPIADSNLIRDQYLSKFKKLTSLSASIVSKLQSQKNLDPSYLQDLNQLIRSIEFMKTEVSDCNSQKTPSPQKLSIKSTGALNIPLSIETTISSPYYDAPQFKSDLGLHKIKRIDLPRPLKPLVSDLNY